MNHQNAGFCAQAQHDLPEHCCRRSLQSYVLSKITLNASDDLPSHVIIKFADDNDILGRLHTRVKTEKQFNCIRPAQRFVERNSVKILEVTCFPGKDYVKHYAHLVKAYFRFKSVTEPRLEYMLPSYAQCARAIVGSNLALMGKIDFVVLGYVERLDQLVTTTWQSPLVEGKALFGWQKTRRPDGRWVSFLACRCSFWGDISEHLIHALVKLNDVKCIIYTGKAGSTDYEVRPNEALATGNSSFLQGELVVWNNVLDETIQSEGTDKVKFGTHVTAASPMEETETWLSYWKERSDWVDCEVGYMAKSCRSNNIEFAYLHLISDNVAREYSENLANERLASVQEKRANLLSLVQNILRNYLQLHK